MKSASMQTKSPDARGNARPQPEPAVKQAPRMPVLGNQATLRLQRTCDGGPDCDLGDDKKKKEDKSSPGTALHRAAASPSLPGEAPPIVRETLNSPGQTLDPQTLSFFESRFDRDFSGVRIHADSKAGQSARAVNALAYAAGSDIAFAPGRFAPGTPAGRRLLAHELAHTLQQPGSAAPSGPLPVSSPDAPEERQAEAMASSALQNRSAARTSRPAAGLLSGLPSGPAPATAVRRLLIDLVNPLDLDPAEDPAPAPAAAPAPAPNPGQATEAHKIAEFDSDSGSARHWDLKQLSTDISAALTSSDRAFVRIFGVYPTKAGETDAEETAMARAQLVERALIGWLGPKIPDSRYETALAQGKAGDPQVQVWIAYKPNVLSNPQGGLPGGANAAETPKEAAPTPVAGAVNYAWHVNATGPKGTSKDRTLQLTIGDSRIVQLSYNVDTQQSQILGGYQLTQDVPLPDGFLNFVNNWIKVQTFEQILGGVAAGGATPSGSVAIVQPSAGAQVLFGSGNATVSVQVAGSVTAASAGPTTAEVNVTPTFTFSF